MCGVAYSCSYVLLLVLIGRLSRDAARAKVRSRRAPGLGRNNREVKRTYETRRVRFRWRVRERVWCWSRSDRVGPLVQTSPRPLTRTPDRVRSGTKTPCRMPNRVRSGTKTPSEHPHKYWGGLDYSRTFYLLTFFQFCTSVFKFFLWSCRLRYLFHPCKRRNRYSHSTLSVRVFRWKCTYGGSTSPLRRISRSISAVSSWSTARNISSWAFFMIGF